MTGRDAAKRHDGYARAPGKRRESISPQRPRVGMGPSCEQGRDEHQIRPCPVRCPQLRQIMSGRTVQKATRVAAVCVRRSRRTMPSVCTPSRSAAWLPSEQDKEVPIFACRPNMREQPATFTAGPAIMPQDHARPQGQAPHGPQQISLLHALIRHEPCAWHGRTGFGVAAWHRSAYRRPR